MVWRKAIPLIFVLFAWGLTACHAVDEEHSQIKIAKPLTELISGTREKMQVLMPETAQAHSIASAKSIPIPTQYYSLQPNTPAFMPNFAHPDVGCKWLGVTGQVFDQQGNPVSKIRVWVTGTLNGVKISQLGMTGTSPAYGPGAYEVQLGSQPVNSQGSLVLQLVDSSGKTVSDKIPLVTYQDCQKNLVLVNFTYGSPGRTYSFPLIFNNAASR
ncbi:MAG TPA: hypothetical protein VF813_10350 [Anaerolineaceae bacterium]